MKWLKVTVQVVLAIFAASFAMYGLQGLDRGFGTGGLITAGFAGLVCVAVFVYVWRKGRG